MTPAMASFRVVTERACSWDREGQAGKRVIGSLPRVKRKGVMGPEADHEMKREGDGPAGSQVEPRQEDHVQSVPAKQGLSRGHRGHRHL